MFRNSIKMGGPSSLRAAKFLNRKLLQPLVGMTGIMKIPVR